MIQLWWRLKGHRELHIINENTARTLCTIPAGQATLIAPSPVSTKCMECLAMAQPPPDPEIAEVRMIDVRGPAVVEILIQDDRVWVNVNDVCYFRAQNVTIETTQAVTIAKGEL